MTRVTATEAGVPTDAMRDYYERFARGGFGLVITEGIYTDKAFAQGYRCQPGLADDEQARAWAGITARIHAHGGRIAAQLMHAGALSQGNPYREHSVAPSAVEPKGRQMVFYYGAGDYPVPAQITEAQIAEVIEGFVDAARRAVNTAGSMRSRFTARTATCWTSSSPRTRTCARTAWAATCMAAWRCWWKC